MYTLKGRKERPISLWFRGEGQNQPKKKERSDQWKKKREGDIPFKKGGNSHGPAVLQAGMGAFALFGGRKRGRGWAGGEKRDGAWSERSFMGGGRGKM